MRCITGKEDCDHDPQGYLKWSTHLDFGLDELKIYNKTLLHYEIEARAEKFLSGL